MDEARVLCKCLLKYGESSRGEVKLQFQLLLAFSVRSLTDFHFLKIWFEEEIPEKFSIAEKQAVSLRLLYYVLFVWQFNDFNLCRFSSLLSKFIMKLVFLLS